MGRGRGRQARTAPSETSREGGGGGVPRCLAIRPPSRLPPRPRLIYFLPPRSSPRPLLGKTQPPPPPSLPPSPPVPPPQRPSSPITFTTTTPTATPPLHYHHRHRHHHLFHFHHYCCHCHHRHSLLRHYIFTTNTTIANDILSCAPLLPLLVSPAPPCLIHHYHYYNYHQSYCHSCYDYY